MSAYSRGRWISLFPLFRLQAQTPGWCPSQCCTTPVATYAGMVILISKEKTYVSEQRKREKGSLWYEDWGKCSLFFFLSLFFLHFALKAAWDTQIWSRTRAKVLKGTWLYGSKNWQNTLRVQECGETPGKEGLLKVSSNSVCDPTAASGSSNISAHRPDPQMHSKSFKSQIQYKPPPRSQTNPWGEPAWGKPKYQRKRFANWTCLWAKAQGRWDKTYGLNWKGLIAC